MKIRAIIDRKYLEESLKEQKGDEITLDIDSYDLDEDDVHDAFDIDYEDDIRQDGYDEGYDQGVEDTEEKCVETVKSDLRDLRDMFVVGKSDAEVLSKLKEILRKQDL